MFNLTHSSANIAGTVAGEQKGTVLKCNTYQHLRMLISLYAVFTFG